MEHDPFGTFIDLIKFDQETISLDKKIKKSLDELQQFEDKKKGIEDALQAVHEQMVQTRKTVDEKELEMQTLDAREKDQKNHLDNATNQKEYESATSEITTLKQQQMDLEEGLIAAWNKLESAKKAHAHKKAAAEEEIKEVVELIEQKEKEIKEAQAAVETRDASRDDKQKGVPEEWLERYKVMRGRVTNPVVPVVDGISCGGCFYIISPQDMSRLEKKALVQCKACYRLIYMKQKGSE